MGHIHGKDETDEKRSLAAATALFYGLARVRLDELSDLVFWLCRGVNDPAPFASFGTWYGSFYDDIYESSVRLLESCETHEM